MAVKKYARFTRAHTAPLEAVPALIGALLATGGSITLHVVGWGVFGVLYHLTGYGMNSYTDWKKGYDKDDPNKQHHPLNTGEIRELDAVMFMWIIAIFTAGLAFILSIHSAHAIALIAAMVISGVAYNLFGKETILKPIPISIAHTLVFVIPYIALGGEINILFYALTVYVYLWILFQISVSGELKDFWQDEANFLKRIRNGYLWSLGSLPILYALSVKVVSLGIAIRVSKHYGHTAVTFWLSFLCVITTILLLATVKSKDNRDTIVKTISMIEGLMVFILAASVSQIIGKYLAAGLIIASVAWVVIFNMLEWRTLLSPKV